MQVNMARCSLLGVLGISIFLVATVSLTNSAPLRATSAASDRATSVIADPSAPCGALCYGISDEDPSHVAQAYDLGGVRFFRKITPFDVRMRMSREDTIPPHSRCNPGDWDTNYVPQMESWYTELSSRPEANMLVSFQRDFCMTKAANRRVSGDKYRAAIQAFHQRYPKVTTFTAWNEPNHADQGHRAKKYARLAGERFRTLYDYCHPVNSPARCDVIAGDFAEPAPSKGWLAEYRAGAQLNDNSGPQKWALHPYTSVRKRAGRRVRRFLASVGPVSELWFTEAGAFHHWRNRGDGPDIPAKRGRQYKDLRYLLGRLATKTFDTRVARLYYYEWADDHKPFGTGLVREAFKSQVEYTKAATKRGHPLCLWYQRAIAPAARANICNRK